MAMVDSEYRQRDALPSIRHLEVDKFNTEHLERQRYPMMTTSAPLGSPTTSTIYSGPPPPYSSSVSTAGLALGLSGRISPPHSTYRATRDEKDSPRLLAKSLPSIHEALSDNRTMPFSSQAAVVPPPQQQNHSLAAPPSGAIRQLFPDAPKGPSNPFLQPVPVSAKSREATYSSQAPVTAQHESQISRPSFPMINTSEPIARSAQHQAPSQYTNGYDPAPAQSPHSYPASRSSHPYSAGAYPPPSRSYRQAEPAPFDHAQQLEDPRSSFGKEPPYAENVKRELDVFETETALKDIVDSSSRTLDFSRVWSQRSYQSGRNGVYNEVLPGLTEVEEMMVHSERVMQSLARIRDIVIAQQHALSEQRIRAARGPYLNDEYASMDTEYRGSGEYGGGDAKKRRGKAAPPGRCHSCNRAETPEWRRGPDGARTLCNACGLHYAKLTRKMGPNKAAALTGSSLRPKNLDPRSPPQELRQSGC